MRHICLGRPGTVGTPYDRADMVRICCGALACELQRRTYKPEEREYALEGQSTQSLTTFCSLEQPFIRLMVLACSTLPRPPWGPRSRHVSWGSRLRTLGEPIHHGQFV
jgi:hypothetical protein